jgi:hypothetical protein
MSHAGDASCLCLVTRSGGRRWIKRLTNFIEGRTVCRGFAEHLANELVQVGIVRSNAGDGLVARTPDSFAGIRSNRTLILADDPKAIGIKSDIMIVFEPGC